MSIVFGIELKDSVSVPANAAAAAMGTASEQAKVLQRAMQSAQAQLTRASALSDVQGVRMAAGRYSQLSEALAALQPALAKEREAEELQKASLKALETAFDGLAPKIEEVTESTEKAKGIFGSIFEAEILKDALERIGDVAIEAGKKMVEMAIEAGESVHRLTTAFGALEGGGEEAGAAVLSMLRDLEKQVPENEATLASWTRQLQGAGVTDLGKLRDSVKAVAGAEALVEGGGQRMLMVLENLNEAAVKGTKMRFNVSQLAGTGLSERDVLAQLGMTPKQIELARKQGTLTGTQIADAMVKALAAKGAKPLEAEMTEVSSVMAKGRDLATRLFEGVSAEPLAEGLRDLFSIFDTAQPSGDVLKATIGGAFRMIFEVAGRVFTLVKNGLLHMIIWGLEAAIALKHLRKWFAEDFPNALHKWEPALVGAAAFVTTLLIPSIVSAAAAVGAWAVTAIPAAIVATGAWIASMAAAAIATLAATWPLLAIAAGVALVAVGIYELVKHWDQVKDFFVHLATGAWDAAKSFVDGLVNGIRDGVGGAVDAVKHLGHNVMAAVKDAFKLGSPSRLMFEAGVNVSKGMALGIEAGSGHVEQAGAGLSTAALPDAGSGGGGRSVTVNLGGVTVHIDASSATTPQQTAEIVEEGLFSLAERIALMMGSAPEPA